MSEQTQEPVIDWSAVERSADFRELTRGRRRFSALGGALGLGLGVLYIVLSNAVPDLMGTEVIGSISLGFLCGVLLVLVTWAITLAYMRRSDRVWGPLEERVRDQAQGGPAGGVAEPRP